MQTQSPHQVAEPTILYFGTPVVLISTLSPDGTPNLAPMSSAFWLGWRCLLGLEMSSTTPQNLLRTGECVLNLPSVHQADAVNRLARLTGSNPVPPHKAKMGYQFQPNKFQAAQLTPLASHTVQAPRVLECPVQLEAVLSNRHDMNQDDAKMKGFFGLFEVRITRVHIHPDILLEGHPNRVDPDRWRPLIMSFQKLYGLGPSQVQASRLAEIDESNYQVPDLLKARLLGQGGRLC